MPSLKGTQTEKNILTAFAGESQARNRYTYYASVAKNEGYVLISEIFTETANQEKEHAKRLFKFLEGGDAEITASFPAGKIGTTAENLQAAASGENEEWTHMYPEFAKVAREEGFPVIAAVMENIAVAEKQHEKQYLSLLTHLNNGTMFKRGEIRSSGVAVTVVSSTRAPRHHKPALHATIHKLTLRCYATSTKQYSKYY